MSDYDLENQSSGRDRSGCRRSAIAGTGIGESSLLNARCNVLAVPTTMWLWICLSELMRSAHCRSMRRWMLNGYMALIRSTSLTRSYARIKSSKDLRSLGERSRGGLEGSKRSNQMAAQTLQTQRMGYRVFRTPMVFLVTTPASRNRHTETYDCP
jgi:hypothetical protein